MSTTYDVYEYTAAAGGYQGNRFFTTHDENKNEPSDNVTTALATNVSEAEARDLTACTPEICRVLAAIEEATLDKKTGKIDHDHINHQLFNAMFAIRSDRDYRHIHNLTVEPGFSVFTPPDENTERNCAIRNLKKSFPRNTGSLGNLDFAFVEIGISLADAAFPID